MNVYKFNLSYECEELEDGIGWDNLYLTHKCKYSIKEFNRICNEVEIKSKERYNEISLYVIEEILINDYGFEMLQVQCQYDFEEE